MPPPRFTGLLDAYAWLDGLVNYERLLGSIDYTAENFDLEPFRSQLAALGNPQRGLRTIHIAGTRGKGSAALILETLLGALGFRTAVYTSPHFTEYRERIRIDGRLLEPAQFVEQLERIAEFQPARGLPGRGFKTVFECLTALYFLVARDANVDWAIVETGLGGRLDATNVLDAGPVLLTRIGLEHTHLLGSTIGAIAGEKAAILKPGGRAVAAAQEIEARQVFEARAREARAPLEWAEQLVPLLHLQPQPNGLRISFRFEDHSLELDLPLFGSFHAENIQNGLAMLSVLRREQLIPSFNVTQLVPGLQRLSLPGRMERCRRNPDLFVDGGHDPTAARAMAETMRAHFGSEPADLLVGMMAEKDHDAFFTELARWPHWQSVYCYAPPSPRALPASALATLAWRHFASVRELCNIQDALELTREAADKNRRVVATGSFYSVGPLRLWGRQFDGTAQSPENTPEAEPAAGDRHP